MTFFSDDFDFEVVPDIPDQLLMLGSENFSSCISFNIIDDNIVEGTESFSLELKIEDQSDEYNVIFEDEIAVISIIDNDDGKHVLDYLSYITVNRGVWVSLSTQ